MKKTKVGKLSFTATSGNRAELTIERNGSMMAVAVVWKSQQSAEDMSEVNRWFPYQVAKLMPTVKLVEATAVVVEDREQGESIRRNFLKAGDR